jgi:hypothetical protein
MLTMTSGWSIAGVIVGAPGLALAARLNRGSVSTLRTAS